MTKTTTVMTTTLTTTTSDNDRFVRCDQENAAKFFAWAEIGANQRKEEGFCKKFLHKRGGSKRLDLKATGWAQEGGLCPRAMHFLSLKIKTRINQMQLKRLALQNCV